MTWDHREKIYLQSTHIELVIGGGLDGAVSRQSLDDLSGFLELGFRHGGCGRRIMGRRGKTATQLMPDRVCARLVIRLLGDLSRFGGLGLGTEGKADLGPGDAGPGLSKQE